MDSKPISVKNLKKYYGKTKAVDDISFEIEKGEIFGFLGPNGAGKTTTIRCMMDFIRPDEGEITILNRNVRINGPEVKKEIGFLPGEVSFYGNWTGWEHIKLLERIKGKVKLDEELIAKFDFDANKKVSDLSTGNRQKLGLILALMHDPKVLILDEPTLGLDPLLQQLFYDILRQAAICGTTIFMSSHNLSEVERICNRVSIIKAGKLVTTEKTNNLKGKKIYSVTVYFKEQPPDPKEFLSEEIELTDKFDDGISLKVKGEVTTLLGKLARYSIKDIEITHAKLEDVFLEYYK